MSLYQRTAEAILGLLNPWLFLQLSASCLPKTILKLIRERKLGVLLSPKKLKDAWFSEFWGIVGPNIRSGTGEAIIVPLLEGRATRGEVTDEPVGPGLSGTVIEVGAGSGLWVDVYKKVAEVNPNPEAETAEGTVRRRNAGGKGEKRVITRIYGVEPNPDQHPHLKRAIEKAGLQDVYQIVPVGIEDLDNPEKWDGRVEKGSVDCIVSILCLCSIPEPEKNIRELYGYLKKGGHWFVYEHVRVEYSWYMRAYQRLLNVFWPHFVGGCLLCRQTEKTLREAGPWENIDVGQPPPVLWYQTLPHVMGVFTK
ncbi:S-adenosyl-L-methionine-dependent methyltransferase [Hypoxylon sp. FL0543]|nr:S-adenosyl-L-methionine-dependent methyltransferase [Hypoxylon sp. FL0543]